MKRLPPSFQKDQRYLRFRVHSKQKHSFEEVVDQIWNTLLSELGNFQASKADIWIVKNKYSHEEKEGIIKVNKEMEDEIRAALLFLESINEEDAFIEVKKTSGMIEKI